MKKEMESEWFSWLKSIIFSVIFVFAIKAFIFTPIAVEGASMMPTYENGDKVIVNKLSKQFTTYDRLDVIVFKVDEKTNYIKRVIGLPGDSIVYEDDFLFVNGEYVAEPYLDAFKEGLQDSGNLTQNFNLDDLTGYTTVPEGYLFVLGDNRRKSLDSRDARLGLVPIDSVLGTVSFRYYPFKQVGFMN